MFQWYTYVAWITFPRGAVQSDQKSESVYPVYTVATITLKCTRMTCFQPPTYRATRRWRLGEAAYLGTLSEGGLRGLKYSGLNSRHRTPVQGLGIRGREILWISLGKNYLYFHSSTTYHQAQAVGAQRLELRLW